MYVRTVKIPSSKGTVNEYVRVVEAYPMFDVAVVPPRKIQGEKTA